MSARGARAVLSFTLACALAAPAPAQGGPAEAEAAVQVAPAGQVEAQPSGGAAAGYAAAELAIAQGKLDAALEELRYVVVAAPQWPAPYRLRAQVYGRLAAEHAPNAAFLRAQALDLAFVLELEPRAPDRAALEQQIAALHRDARAAAVLEAKRRRLRTPALVVTSLAIAGIAAGALLIGITPADKPTAPGHRGNDIAGAATLVAGAGLAIAAGVLGGLSRKQSKRDAAVVRYYEVAQRPRAEWMVGAGGVGVRF